MLTATHCICPLHLPSPHPGVAGQLYIDRFSQSLDRIRTMHAFPMTPYKADRAKLGGFLGYLRQKGRAAHVLLSKHYHGYILPEADDREMSCYFELIPTDSDAAADAGVAWLRYCDVYASMVHKTSLL